MVPLGRRSMTEHDHVVLGWSEVTGDGGGNWSSRFPEGGCGMLAISKLSCPWDRQAGMH